jgi:hypothetical protein
MVMEEVPEVCMVLVPNIQGTSFSGLVHVRNGGGGSGGGGSSNGRFGSGVVGSIPMDFIGFGDV